MRVFFDPEVVKIWSVANVTLFSHPIFGASDHSSCAIPILNPNLRFVTKWFSGTLI